MKNKRI